MEQCHADYLMTLFIDMEVKCQCKSMILAIQKRSLVLYPDKCCRIGKSGSDHQYYGITICCNWQGHLALRNGHNDEPEG
jgi:hypothetical protein